MKVTITFDISYETQCAIGYCCGNGKPTSYEDVKANIQAVVNATHEDFLHELQRAKAG